MNWNPNTAIVPYREAGPLIPYQPVDFYALAKKNARNTITSIIPYREAGPLIPYQPIDFSAMVKKNERSAAITSIALSILSKASKGLIR